MRAALHSSSPPPRRAGKPSDFRTPGINPKFGLEGKTRRPGRRGCPFFLPGPVGERGGLAPPQRTQKRRSEGARASPGACFGRKPPLGRPRASGGGDFASVENRLFRGRIRDLGRFSLGDAVRAAARTGGFNNKRD
jgi:hypothetical protein